MTFSSSSLRMALGALVLLVAQVPVLFGCGFMLCEPPPDLKPIPKLAQTRVEVRRLAVKVQVDNFVSRVKMEQDFDNTTPWDLEGRYVFPLPKGASVSSFAMIIDGKRIEAKVSEKDQAKRDFQRLIRERREPALLEFLGGELFQASLGVIPAGQMRTVELIYEQTLQPKAGVFELRIPFQAGGKQVKEIAQVSLEGKLLTNFTLQNVYSPSHEVVLDRYGTRKAKFAYEAKNISLDRDFSLFFSAGEKELGLNALTHRVKGEDGYFMLMLTPPVGDSVQAVPRDVTLVVDVSGSMNGEKLEQAKRAVNYCIEKLQEQDRFRVVKFSSAVKSLTKGFWKASKEKRQEAIALVDQMKARGGTNIHGAVQRALRNRDESRSQVLIFLTDGEPTEGITDADTILTKVQAANEGMSRIYVVGIGYKLNVKLLDGLSGRNRGSSVYVKPKQSIDKEMERWYRNISYPVLTNLELDFGEVETEFTYPETLPDLHQGEQLLLVGRYRNPQNALVTLKGRSGGGEQSYLYDVDFPEEELERDFLPRLWARRRVGYLLDRIRLLGEKAELKDEVLDLAKEYSIVTPYTSFLVQGPHLEKKETFRNVLRDARPAVPRPLPGPRAPRKDLDLVRPLKGKFKQQLSQPMDAFGLSEEEDSFDEDLSADGGGFADRPEHDPKPTSASGRMGNDILKAFRKPAPTSARRAAEAEMGALDLKASTGKSAVQAAEKLRSLKESSVVGESHEAPIRHLSGKTFEQRDGVWTDRAFDPKAKLPELAVRFGSEAYFLLLGEKPELGKFLGLGEKVVVVFEGVVLRVGDAGLEELTAEALGKIFSRN